MQHVPQALCLQRCFSLILNPLRVSICLMILGISEAALVFCSFCEGRAQQITASGDVAMKSCPCLLNTVSKFEGAIP